MQLSHPQPVRGAAKIWVRHYTPTAQVLHWITALLMFTILPVAWHIVTMNQDDPRRETWLTIHKSIGITILALTIIRIVWRWITPPPSLPGTMGQIEAAAAVLSHWLLYIVLITMPVSGYLQSAAGGHSVIYFGLFEIPSLVPQNKNMAEWATAIHNAGQWAVYTLIVLHVLATVWHLAVRRDGILDRILPVQE
jgi:cytochrome b561